MVELKTVNTELVDALPKWALKSELQEYFRSWPALQDWNRPDLVTQRLDWAYGIYEDGLLVGMAQLYYPNHVAKTVELGMLIDTELTKDRYKVSDEAHLQIVDYVFKRLEFQKISMRILANRDKLSSRLQAFGYKVEGRLVRSVKLNGFLRDEILLALHKEI